MEDFIPDFVSPPGDTIADLLEETGMSIPSFAAQTGFSIDYAKDLISGAAVVSSFAAWRLSVVLGSTTEFWKARQRNYERMSGRVCISFSDIHARRRQGA